ncbi:hypothetical protein QBC47DRAFT_432598 [Echria macrotheca]|uniref:Rho-GAP domain-containing protein n=1 Tax=Echria macrotheca TaxID=438768 RepID=A0AAJ0B776_9PEZI|nr:hypothetical protein QBC47DRAFT_432598 [Echria macrotheca]
MSFKPVHRPLMQSHTGPSPPPRAEQKMDWISINTGCFAVSNAIAKTSLALGNFVREVRESRPDLDSIATLLHSLDSVLDLLKDDAATFPPRLARATPFVLGNCHRIVDEIDGCLGVLGRGGVPRIEKKSRWLASRDQIEKLRGTLDGYRVTLALAVDLIALTDPARVSTEHDARSSSETDLVCRDELALIASRIREAAELLRAEADTNGAFASLRRYVDLLYDHAISALDQELDRLQLRRRDPSFGDAPDSAIELSDDVRAFPLVTTSKAKEAVASDRVDDVVAKALWPKGYGGVPVGDIDELLDELAEMPVRPPTPPPRARARSSSTGHRPTLSNFSLPSSLSNSPHPVVHRDHPSGGSVAGSESSDPHSHDGSAPGVRTVITSGNRQPTSQERPQSRLGKVFGHIRHSTWENPRSEVPVPPSVRPSTSGQNGQDGPPPIRRRNSSISSAFRTFSLRRKPSPGPDPALAVEDIGAIFGVPLTQSMLVARGLAGARHDGGGSTSREYPLCVLRCVYFIRDAGGVQAPDIFGQDGNPAAVAELRDIFSDPGTSYGKEGLDWARYSVYDAADLVLLFLTELPAPLIPEAVVKRWVVLSRQATIRGSLAMRLDQGLDFWEEAFTGLRGPARALFKLLLNLWGEIADAADENDMTAERLAGRIMRPLMHMPVERYDTDFLLGLAFMIRKRSEYNLGLEKGRKSNAAF